jgi:hypothetical protein
MKYQFQYVYSGFCSFVNSEKLIAAQLGNNFRGRGRKEFWSYLRYNSGTLLVEIRKNSIPTIKGAILREKFFNPEFINRKILHNVP